MKIHRFYINTPLKNKRELEINDPKLINQWKNVLKFETGEKVILFNNTSSDFLFSIKEIGDKKVTLNLVGERKVDFKAKYNLHLLLSLIKRDMFELALEKVTEIGVEKIIPILAERSIKNKLNLERSKNIIKEASEQSGKTQIPEIIEPEKLEMSIQNRELDRLYIALDPKGQKFSKKILTNKISEELSQPNADQVENFAQLRHEKSSDMISESTEISNAGMRRKGKSLGVFIGPEGGFTEKEISLFKENKIPIFSLGEQILRAETATIAITSLLQLEQ